MDGERTDQKEQVMLREAALGEQRIIRLPRSNLLVTSEENT
jgi:hypothetical protein